MTEGDSAAVHIELVPADAEVLGRRNDLCSKCFVDFNEVDVIDAHSGAGHCLTAGFDRAEAHDLGVDCAHARGDDASDRRKAEFLGFGVAHDNDSGGAVIERASVTSGDGSVGAEDRLELSKLFLGGSGANAIVLLDDYRVAIGIDSVDRGDLTFEEATLKRCGCTLL